MTNFRQRVSGGLVRGWRASGTDRVDAVYRQHVPPSLAEGLDERARGSPLFARRNASFLSGMTLVLLSVAATAPGRHLRLAVYALSFWHYYLYWLACCLATVSLSVFKRDAIAMKTVSLVALGVAYLSGRPDPASLAVMAAGFLLNALGARALGSDRTYYGNEVVGLPRRHIIAFPYSWTSHPMLLGNVAAFGGTLINADFRRSWWPLACIHVALNFGLLWMEVAVAPAAARWRRTRTGGTPTGTTRPFTARGLGVAGAVAASGGLLGWVAGSWPESSHPLLYAAIGAGIAAHAVVTYVCYSFAGLPLEESRTGTLAE